MADLTFIDSSGVGAIIGSVKTLPTGCIVLHGAHDGVGKVLDLMGVDRAIPNLHVIPYSEGEIQRRLPSSVARDAKVGGWFTLQSLELGSSGAPDWSAGRQEVSGYPAKSLSDGDRYRGSYLPESRVRSMRPTVRIRVRPAPRDGKCGRWSKAENGGRRSRPPFQAALSI